MTPLDTDMSSTAGGETPLPLLNKARLNLKDYTLLTDVGRVVGECPTPLSCQDVLGKLTRLGLEVQTEAIEEIFAAIDLQREGKVPARLFARHYSYTVQQLSEDAFYLQQQVEATHAKVDSIKQQLQDPSSFESLNSWGLSSSSSLSVHIHRVSGVNPPRACSLVAICERQRQVTRTLPSNFTDGWEETLHFNVATGAGDVLFSLLADNEILAQCAIALPSLRDQRTHEAWVDMVTSGKQGHVRLSVSLLWIHNKRQHLRDQLHDEERSLTATLESLRAVESRLKSLGMRWDEDWTDSLMRKIHGTFECVRQAKCSSQCVAM